MTPYRFSAYGTPGSLKAQVYLRESSGDKLLATMTGLADSEAVERWARSVLKAQSPRTVVQSSGKKVRKQRRKDD